MATTYCTVEHAVRKAKITHHGDLNFDSQGDYVEYVTDTIKSASRRIDRYCQRPDGFFEGGATLTEYHSGRAARADPLYPVTVRIEQDRARRSTFFLEQTPIMSITSVNFNTAQIGETDNWEEKTAYRVDNGTGKLVFATNCVPSEGFNNIKFVYKAGYTTAPDDIADACAEMVGNALQAELERRMKSAFRMDKAPTLDLERPEIFTKDIKVKLDSYRKRRLGWW